MSDICWTRMAIAGIDSQGFWLHCGEEELYLPFALFPWFEQATVAQLCRVGCLGASRLYWPALEVELGLDRIRSAMALAQCAGGVAC